MLEWKKHPVVCVTGNIEYTVFLVATYGRNTTLCGWLEILNIKCTVFLVETDGGNTPLCGWLEILNMLYFWWQPQENGFRFWIYRSASRERNRRVSTTSLLNGNRLYTSGCITPSKCRRYHRPECHIQLINKYCSVDYWRSACTYECHCLSRLFNK